MSNKEGKTKKIKEPKTRVQKAIKAISIILIILVVLIVAIVAGSWTYVQSMLGKVKEESIDENAIGIDNATAENLKGYRNIALLGIDSRADDYGLGNRSDCIIIASINEQTKDIKLISVYRDTYLQLVENGKTTLDKVTHAYSYAGAQNTLLALNTNLDLNITEYVTVNFDTIELLVDKIGGVNIKITSAESTQISGTNGAGTYNLDGNQALAYGRIRKIDNDYQRTERMRNVIEAILAKVKKMNATQLNSLVSTMFPHISTNISSTEIISLLTQVLQYNINESIGWPYSTKGITLDRRWYGVPCTLESNVIKLHKEIFNQTDYTLPEEIKTISDKIVAKTGYKEDQK